MKKIQKCLIALLVFCLTAGALIACGQDTTTAGTDANTPGTTTTAPDTTVAPTDPTPEQTAYKFTVVLEGTNEPVEGVGVQLCQVEPYVCLMPQYTDAEGKVSYTLTGDYTYGVYQVHIMEDDLPEGYTFDNEALLTTADVHEYTLVLKKAGCEHNFVGEECIKCGEKKTYTFTVVTKYPDVIENVDGKEQVVEAGAAIPGVSLLITDGTKMVAQGTTNDKGEFSFEAPKFVSSDELTGYVVVVLDGIPAGHYTPDDNSFVINSYICTVEFYEEVIEGDYTAFNPRPVKIGETVNFTLAQKRVDDADDPNADPWFITSHDDSFYYFSVTPSKPGDVGHYKITITGVPEGVTIYLGHFPSTHAMVAPAADVYDVSNTPVLEFNMEERYLKDSTGAWTYNNSWIFGVRVEGETDYPVSFEVKVERERDIIEGVDVVQTKRETVAIVENAKKAADVIGDVSGKKLTTINFSAASKMDIVLGADGYYHVGSADGAILMVNITKNNPLLGGEVSFINVNATSGTENLLVSVIVDEKHHEVYYYADMLKAYGELCNADGVYPVNEQLYNFLKSWTSQRASGQITNGLDEDHAFLLGCAYYA